MVVNVSYRVRRAVYRNNHLTILLAFDRVNGFVAIPRGKINLTGGLDVRVSYRDFV